MKLTLHAAALSLSLFGLACHQPDVVVRTAAGEQAAVGRYSTFGILMPDPQELADEDIDSEAIKRFAILSVEKMKSLGYKPVKPEEADMVIALGPSMTTYGTPRVHSDVSGNSQAKFDETQRAEGTLTVSFVDAKSKQIVLQRVAETRVLQTGPSEEKLNLAVTQVFDGIPQAPAQSASAAVSPAAVPPAAPPAAAAAEPAPEEGAAAEPAASAVPAATPRH
jgi:hypothetical protein